MRKTAPRRVAFIFTSRSAGTKMKENVTSMFGDNTELNNTSSILLYNATRSYNLE